MTGKHNLEQNFGNSAVTLNLNAFLDEKLTEQADLNFEFLDKCEKWNELKEAMPCNKYLKIGSHGKEPIELSVPEELQTPFFNLAAFLFDTLIKLCDIASETTVAVNQLMAMDDKNACGDKIEELQECIRYVVSYMMALIANLEDKEISGIRRVHEEMKNFSQQNS